jgi:hypothetical protein
MSGEQPPAVQLKPRRMAMVEPYRGFHSAHFSSSPSDQLGEEYEREKALFEIQPAIVQRFLEAQARQVAEAFSDRARHVRFNLPDRVVMSTEESTAGSLPPEVREQSVGRLTDRLTGKTVYDTLRERLAALELASDPNLAVSARLIRYAASMYLIHNMLPAGRTVTYALAEDDEFPTLPVGDRTEPDSALMAATDAVVEEGTAEKDRGSLQVPFVPAARRFYLPQWVAFDEQNRLLVNSLGEAEAHIASMQQFLNILFAARSLAPYAIADKEFQKKRYGMLGQLINQGRALARYQTREIIRAIQTRAAAQSLNRGLSLDLPYFDDQSLERKTHHFVIIPAGRIMFVPAFVVRAAIEEQAKVAQDTRFNHSTRKHLLAELKELGEAFEADKD